MNNMARTNMNIRQLKQQKAVILGAARSGIAAARLLHEHVAGIFVSDLAKVEDKIAEKQILEGLGIPFEFGIHSDRVHDADFVILSPGISPATPLVQAIREKGIPVFSELEMASWFYSGPIIGITGSNGKTTTTAITGRILQQLFADAIIAGNIGTPFSGEVCTNPAAPCAVVEISSFQLETIDSFHPHVAVILNLAPNHLDWYKTYEDYVSAKLRILMNLNQHDTLIYNGDDELLTAKVQSCPARKLRFSAQNQKADAFLKDEDLFILNSRILAVKEIKLRGPHNYMNALAAGLAARCLNGSNDQIRIVLTSFSGVEHRLEFVTTIKGITFINDSKATTIESLAVALGSFNTPVILIAGGKDKGSDYSKVNTLLKRNVRQVILIGTAREKIMASWQGVIPLTSASTLSQAITEAYQLARPGDTVLLSPACASFDMFKDFEDRGRQFKQEVQKLKEKMEYV
jgi:UDP-N-acetylmuramoylalanine--D-glutamate ligase